MARFIGTDKRSKMAMSFFPIEGSLQKKWVVDLFSNTPSPKPIFQKSANRLRTEVFSQPAVLRVGDVALCCACGKAILLTRCYMQAF